MAPYRLWREGPPFSWRQFFGSFACIAIGHHDPVQATHHWREETRSWEPQSADARAWYCRRCGRTTSYRFGMLRFR
jgi:hypothetical protein